jgi:superfamily I DNA/RNA helicase
MGIYFQLKGRKSYKATLFRSVLNYTRWADKGDKLSISELKDILEYTGTNLNPYPTEERLYDLKEFGFGNTDRWFDVFKNDPEECLYIREMLRQKEELRLNARVQLSTIHSAKGGEATNVLLILDNTKTIREAGDKSFEKADEENRVWYVGVTRTKQNLYILAAKKEDKGYDIESLG